MVLGTLFTILNFHFNLRMDLIVLCDITLGWKDLPGTIALAYLDHSLVKKKMKHCDYGPWDCIHTPSLSC